VVDALVHPSAVPSDLPAELLRLRPDASGAVALDPERAGWRYLSFRAQMIGRDAPATIGGTGETALLPIFGADLSIRTTAGELTLPGRPSPFEALPSALYLPPGVEAQVSIGTGSAAATTLLAVASAPSSGRAGVATQPVAVAAKDVRIEVRGAGNATRQINHIITPDFPADRLEVVEVLTPSGNWSSWPPHKHDFDDMPSEAVLEEIYYYRFERADAWALQRVYRADRSRDATWEVRSGDVVIVTDGYHPFVAGHGDHAYYLNALAGDRRTMACSFDPDLDWVRESWRSMEPDRRVPLVTG
jgi:5-deoxy-glucuronate isomerase